MPSIYKALDLMTSLPKKEQIDFTLDVRKLCQNKLEEA
jgi:hypothetical protein